MCVSAFNRRWTPLHLAAYYGHEAVAAALLAHGADVNAYLELEGCGVLALFWATVGVRRAALADRDGIEACRCGCT